MRGLFFIDRRYFSESVLTRAINFYCIFCCAAFLCSCIFRHKLINMICVSSQIAHKTIQHHT